jgi:hypothetical protein
MLLLGAAHGINPGMGWLFAVALGLQRRSRREVWGALVPLAAGHAVAVAVVLLLVAVLGIALPTDRLKWGVAGALFVVGVTKMLRQRHPRYGGMAVNGRQVATWSFLMATAHGAGLMAVPFLLALPSAAATPHSAPARGHAAHLVGLAAPGSPLAGLTMALVHTAGYLLVTGLVAVIVYERLGLRLLGRAWFNVDRMWAGALIAAAIVTPMVG